MFIDTVTLGLALLNSSTIFFMYGPSPPVKPFQKARATLGPVYVSPSPNAPLEGAPAPGGVLDPEQAARAEAAPTAPNDPRSRRRDRSRGLLVSDMRVVSFRVVARCAQRVCRGSGAGMSPGQGVEVKATAVQDAGPSRSSKYPPSTRMPGSGRS